MFVACSQVRHSWEIINCGVPGSKSADWRVNAPTNVRGAALIHISLYPAADRVLAYAALSTSISRTWSAARARAMRRLSSSSSDQSSCGMAIACKTPYRALFADLLVHAATRPRTRSIFGATSWRSATRYARRASACASRRRLAPTPPLSRKERLLANSTSRSKYSARGKAARVLCTRWQTPQPTSHAVARSTAAEDQPVVLGPRLDNYAFRRDSALLFDKYHFNSSVRH